MAAHVPSNVLSNTAFAIALSSLFKKVIPCVLHFQQGPCDGLLLRMVKDARPPVCTGEPVSAGHKVGKGKAAAQIERAVLQARVDSTCRTAQKKGLLHLSWLPAGHCLGLGRACAIAASLWLQTTGRPHRLLTSSGC